MYGGSIKNIRMCIGGTGWSNDLVITDMSKTLLDVGVATSTVHNVCYDFDPVIDPLFKASL